MDEIKAAGLEYTVIATSAFYEFWYTAATGFDAKNGKVVVLGDGNQKFSSTLTADIAKVTNNFLIFFLIFFSLFLKFYSIHTARTKLLDLPAKLSLKTKLLPFGKAYLERNYKLHTSLSQIYKLRNLQLKLLLFLYYKLWSYNTLLPPILKQIQIIGDILL